ncbi:hypothetical protein [Bradyrhizobium japonicum]|uniref:hypothetical protein n=1 Tax=Bradyrhizobium japonicum TaxID=375 RepID=UPI0012BC9249|nr:hypothetical protein [Bradyrhizobium japonicum]
MRCGARNLPPGFYGMYGHRRRDFEIVEFRWVAYPRSNNRFYRNDPMKSPTRCALWRNPNLVTGIQADRFERIDTFVDDSHLMRHLLRCRECGQRYFFEFYEEIDYEDGNDSQYATYIPIETDAEIEMLKRASSMELLQFFPRLQRDFPKNSQRPTARWVE